MYVVYCECGYSVSFSDSEVNQMYQQYKHGRHYGLPERIYCGDCENRGIKSICSIVRSED